MITASQNRELHRLLTVTGRMGVKMELVGAFSRGRTTSSKELSPMECDELIRWLKRDDEQEHGKSRGSVLHYMHLLGYENDQIWAFVKNIGSNNPGKKSLNNLGGSELNKVVTQVKEMYGKSLKIRR